TKTRPESLKLTPVPAGGTFSEPRTDNSMLGFQQMKAARIHQHGGPEVLTIEDIPEPRIKANEILVRVRACALNHLDLFTRAGIPGMKFAMPHILGSDIAGEVVAVGDLCRRVQPGWRVLLAPGQSCRQCEQCLL